MGTNISWTTETWNCITGCNIISPGCTNCYAMHTAHRIQAMGQSKNYDGTTRKSGGRSVWTGRVNLIEKALNYPRTIKKPSMIFVNSMSDAFHPHVPLSFLLKMFEVMVDCPHHIFQVLTKRPKNLLEYHLHLPWPDNIWMGVSVESPAYKYRIDLLRKCQAKVKFISFEPLLEEVSPDLTGIDWAIAGGESGSRARPMNPEWIETILTSCRKSDTAFFLKQLGGKGRDKGGDIWKGQQWHEFPAVKDNENERTGSDLFHQAG